MSKRVHVVFTGGTLGSVASGASTDLEAGVSRQLLSWAPAGEDAVFETSEPFAILSEDATCEHWTVLVRHLASLDLSRLDAVIVAHGSDTLAWTAHALAYGLLGIPKPVVMVAADRPLADPLSNGPANFADAIRFAFSEQLPGVYAAWKNPGEATTIHLATRLLPSDLHEDRFRSVRDLHFGTVSAEGFRRNAVEGNPSRSHLAKARSDEAWKRSRLAAQEGCRFETGVLVLAAQPGTDHRRFVPPESWKAVLQLAYHSGTAASGEAETSLAAFADRCALSGVPVIVGPCRHRDAPYASVQRLERRGVRFAPSMAESALVVKLRWLLGAGSDPGRLEEAMAFDLLPAPPARS